MNWKIKGLLIAVLVIIADQVSKYWIVTQYLAVQKADSYLSWLMQKGEQAEYAVRKITDFLNIVMVWNPGVSFGMLQTDKGYVTYGLTAMAVIVSFGFLVWLWREPKPLRAVAIGLIVGGALGNVWDRLRFGAVIDFIDVHAATHHWPAFNVADSAITIGVILLLIETIFLVEGKK